jgi:hypothetical protein
MLYKKLEEECVMFFPREPRGFLTAEARKHCCWRFFEEILQIHVSGIITPLADGLFCEVLHLGVLHCWDKKHASKIAKKKYRFQRKIGI